MVTEAAGAGTDTGADDTRQSDARGHVENLTYTGAGNFAGTGNNLSNVITGGAGNDTLAAAARTPPGGVDTLIGGAGDDTYVVSNAGDVVTEAAGGGTDTVRTALASLHAGRQRGEPDLHRSRAPSPAPATPWPTSSPAVPVRTL